MIYREWYGFPIRKPMKYIAYRWLRWVCWRPGRLGLWLLAKTDGLCRDCGPDTTVN